MKNIIIDLIVLIWHPYVQFCFFFYIRGPSVISYIAFVLSLFVPHLSLFFCASEGLYLCVSSHILYSLAFRTVQKVNLSKS